MPLCLGCANAAVTNLFPNGNFSSPAGANWVEVFGGGTTTYGAISQRLGNPNAVRAVGGAVGRNPISIIVPCHRVLGADGSLTGYAGGLDRKTALLRLEGVNTKFVCENLL